jgi:hypothetical protein
MEVSALYGNKIIKPDTAHTAKQKKPNLFAYQSLRATACTPGISLA